MEDLEKRIAEGVALLRARFGDRMRATPSLSDPQPLGSGGRNRHGLPRIPVKQSIEDELLPMDIGEEPQIAPERWRLVVDGAVEQPLSLCWEELLTLPQVEQASDFHCVTGWSVLDLPWKGVRLETIAALVRPAGEASHVMLHGYDRYSTNLPLEEALKPDVLLAHTLRGAPIPTRLGGPVRAVVPQLYAWKGAKWISRIEVMTRDRRGYWEIRGYSNTAYPWRDDRNW